MTVDHDRYADDLAAYALGALSDAEAEAFERHLTGCDACARELEQARAVVGALPAAVPQHRAPPQLKRAVMRAIGRPARERRRLSLRRPALALAGGLAAAALALGAYGLGASLSGGTREVVAASVDETRLPGARAALAARDDLGVLRAERLPRPSAGQLYVVWVDRGQRPIYASSFNVRPDGSGEAGVPELDGVKRVMVTRERSTAVTAPSERPVLTVEL